MLKILLVLVLLFLLFRSFGKIVIITGHQSRTYPGPSNKEFMEERKKEEGKITVIQNPGKSDRGEFVDFEEVKKD